ncbi:MAG: hypothetical protein IJZ71_09455 [Treponema sp.]|nr:hypothetical protein [Treponema sp.]MBQ8777696.1 hypothetical protein [Treponema sp.]
MKLNEYLPIILEVLKSPIVIGTVIAMLIVISFAKYVCNYTKKPPKTKGKKNKAVSPAQNPAPATEENPEAEKE